MMKIKRAVHISFLALLILNLNIQGQEPKDSIKNSETETTLVFEGMESIDFTVTMIDSTEITLSDLKGKIVLLTFWATWCGPCMMEFKEIPTTILDRFKNPDFVFLPISRGETFDVVQNKMEQLKEQGIEFNVGLDPQKEIYNLYAKQYIPRNFLIDRNGKVVHTTIGYEKESLNMIADKIDGLLKDK